MDITGPRRLLAADKMRAGEGLSFGWGVHAPLIGYGLGLREHTWHACCVVCVLGFQCVSWLYVHKRRGADTLR